MGRRIAITGATGRIGRPLAGRLIERGDSVAILSRDPARAAAVVPGAAGYVRYDGDAEGDWRGAIDGADAVVHLAGGSIFEGRQTRATIEASTDERVRQTAAVVAAIEAARARPSVLVAASSVGFYGYADRSNAPVDESASAGSDWWGRDGARWEEAASAAAAFGVRVVAMRTSWFLDSYSLAPQAEQFRRGFGGWTLPAGAWRPWVHPADEVRLMELALDDDRVTGPLNATSPNPVTSREFAAILGRVTDRRAWLPMPGAVLRLGMGATAEIVTHGRRIVPHRALELGFEFRFPTLELALADILGAADEEMEDAAPAGN